VDEKELPHSVLAIEVFSVALPLALWSIFQPQFLPFGTCHADQPKADVPSITRFLTGPTDPGPVSSNNHDCPVGLISTIRLTNLVRSSPLSTIRNHSAHIDSFPPPLVLKWKGGNIAFLSRRLNHSSSYYNQQCDILLSIICHTPSYSLCPDLRMPPKAKFSRNKKYDYERLTWG